MNIIFVRFLTVTVNKKIKVNVGFRLCLLTCEDSQASGKFLFRSREFCFFALSHLVRMHHVKPGAICYRALKQWGGLLVHCVNGSELLKHACKCRPYSKCSERAIIVFWGVISVI